MSRQPLELDADLAADNSRIVDESRKVLEVDGADGADLIGTVPAKCRHVILSVSPGVPQTKAALGQRGSDEFLGCVQAKVDFAAIRPVRVDIQFSRAQSIIVAQ